NNVSAATFAGLLDAMTYRDVAATPTGGPRTFTLTSIQDDGGTANGRVDTTQLSLGSTVNLDRAPTQVTHAVALFEGESVSAALLDFDPDGDAVTITAAQNGAGRAGTVGQPLAGTYGTLTLTGNDTYSYSANNAAAINAAPAGSNLVDTFTYTVSDGRGGTTTETLSFVIDGPAAHTVGVLAGASASATPLDTDPDGDTLTATAVQTAAGTVGSVGQALTGQFGTLTLNSDDSYSYLASNSAAIHAVPVGIRPTDNFTYTVSDGHGGTTTETLSFVIDRPVSLTATAINTNESFGAAAAATPVDLFANVSITTGTSQEHVHAVALTKSGIADGANEILNFDGTDVTLDDGHDVTT